MSHAQVSMYGTLWCGDCKRTKQLFGEQRVRYDFKVWRHSSSSAAARAARPA